MNNVIDLRKKVNMRTILLSDCTIEVIAETEQCTPVGQFDSGDPELDRETEQTIFDAINSGDVWGWCTVEVKLTYKHITASDYLGCCSYKNEQDFITDSGYYEDMVQTCLAELNQQLVELLAN